MLEDHVDHQPDGFSCPVSPVASSQMNQTLENKMQIHHIKPKGRSGVGHHGVGLHDVESGARLQVSHLRDIKDPSIRIHCYLEQQ